MNQETLSRRVVLHEALAVGCVLCVPIALSGCDSKQSPSPSSAPPASPAPAGTPASKADNAAPPATTKVPQASVQYQHQPKGEQKCADCLHFIAESKTCKLVDGSIDPQGWCILWAKKA